jgi:exodeoxyribonuclease X
VAEHRIRVGDNETTGLEPTDKVCELGWCDLVNDGSGWRIDRHGSSLHRVEVMPPPARAVHHISAEETWPHPPFSADEFWATLARDGVNLLAAHNLAYDQAYWGEPRLPVLCTFKSARQLWPDAPSHGNGSLRYWLQDQGLIAPEHEHTLPPHRAGPDAYVTAHILLAMLGQTTASQMVAWTKLPLLQPRCPIGDPWRDKPWPEVDEGFVRWITTKQGMDADTAWNARRELERRRGARP